MFRACVYTADTHLINPTCEESVRSICFCRYERHKKNKIISVKQEFRKAICKSKIYIKYMIPSNALYVDNSGVLQNRFCFRHFISKL